MKVVVNTPTGNIGSALTGHLLESGVDVTVLARNPDKVRVFADSGATVRQGELDNRDFLVDATKGAGVLFWVTPPDYQSTDLRGYQNMLADNGAEAIKANGIRYVIDLSSVGAQHASGTGPIAHLHDVEKKFEKTGANVLHLRPSYFMENFFSVAQGIATDGGVFMTTAADEKMDMISTRDIAREAASLIGDPNWTGSSILELLGPEAVSYGEATEMLGEAIGKELKYVQVSPDQSRSAMIAMGINEHLCEVLHEMFDAFSAGKCVPVTQNQKRTSTTFKQFANEVFRPGFEAMAG
jgi:uncharacterized protein YbjT (DUF2867 family)